jgi:hypothetical protein
MIQEETIEKEIALTQEYKTALIAEAVTGKIDVRDFVVPEVVENIQIDFEPTCNYEIIGGEIIIPNDLLDKNTNAWFAHCVGAPDIPESMGGSIKFISSLNLEMINKVFRLDARATTFLQYSPLYHTNKIRIILNHPPGEIKRFQLILEIFK